MAIDLMLGGDLRFHLDRTDAFKESQFRLYVAEMGLAIRFLNEKRIVHRYIKHLIMGYLKFLIVI